jgi:hypothetical protein
MGTFGSTDLIDTSALSKNVVSMNVPGELSGLTDTGLNHAMTEVEMHKAHVNQGGSVSAFRRGQKLTASQSALLKAVMLITQPQRPWP